MGANSIGDVVLTFNFAEDIRMTRSQSVEDFQRRKGIVQLPTPVVGEEDTVDTGFNGEESVFYALDTLDDYR